MQNESITLALTGASGLQYGLRLLECLLAAGKTISLLVSQAAHAVAVHELDITMPKQTSKLRDFLIDHFQAAANQLQVFDQHEWTAPIASGSNAPDAMVICPCSSGTLAAIANGLSNNLIERAADVMLKEGRKLVLVPRETPLNLTQVDNMSKLLRMNTVIMPAAPGFYHRPTSINELIDFMVARILDHLAIPNQLIKRWGADL
jgi:4-hydroxy-3-polyprenylbenzoate decarboxylase